MSKFIDFNLNDIIKFKVDERGLKIFKDSFYEYSPKDRFKFENFYKEDSEGYYKLQMWEFIRIFHKEFHMGNNNVACGMNVKLEIK